MLWSLAGFRADLAIMPAAAQRAAESGRPVLAHRGRLRRARRRGIRRPHSGGIGLGAAPLVPPMHLAGTDKMALAGARHLPTGPCPDQAHKPLARRTRPSPLSPLPRPRYTPAHGRGAFLDSHRRQRRPRWRRGGSIGAGGALARRPGGARVASALDHPARRRCPAARRHPVPPVAAILALRRHRRPADRRRQRRRRRRAVRRRHRADRRRAAQPGLSRHPRADAAAVPRRPPGRLPLAPRPPRRQAAAARRRLHPAGRQHRGRRPVPPRPGPGPPPGLPRRGPARLLRPPDRPAHPGPPHPGLAERRRHRARATAEPRTACPAPWSSSPPNCPAPAWPRSSPRPTASACRSARRRARPRWPIPTSRARSNFAPSRSRTCSTARRCRSTATAWRG